MKEEFERAYDFSKTTYEDWLLQTKTDLKQENLEKILRQISIEEVDFFPLYDHFETGLTLKTFPEKTLVTKYLFSFAENDSSEGHDYVVSEKKRNESDFYSPEGSTFKDEKKSFFRLKLETLEEFKKADITKGSILLDISSVHNAGASIIQELTAFILLMLEVAEKKKELLNRVRVLVSISSNFFQEIAKLRALRFLAEKIFESEKNESMSFEIHALSSLREQTLYDPWVNLLRNTTSTEASILGGANFVSTFGEDILFRFLGQNASPLSEKLSRNIPKVLLEESKLSTVCDPSQGAFLIENLSVQMVEKAWERARLIKKLDQEKVVLFSEEVKEIAEKRLLEARKRKTVITGVNQFSHPEDKIHGLDLEKFEKEQQGAFPLRRNAREFELLRFQVEKLKHAFKGKVIVWKEEAKLSGRATFSQNYFEILGVPVAIEVAKSIKELQDKLEGQDDFYILVAQDEEYKALLESVEVSKPLYLAGKVEKTVAISDCIYMGQEVYSVLASLVSKWGEMYA